MATTPTLADLAAILNKLPQGATEAKKALLSLKTSIADLASLNADKASDMIRRFVELGGEIAKSGKYTDALAVKVSALGSDCTSAIKALSGGFGEFLLHVRDLNEQLGRFRDGFTQGAGTANKEMAESVVQAASLAASFTEFSKIPKSFSDLSGEVGKITSSYKDLVEAIPMFGKALMQSFEKGEYARAYEDQLVKMAAKSGDLYGMLGADKLFGNDYNTRVDAILMKSISSARDSANVMGMALGEAISRNVKIAGTLSSGATGRAHVIGTDMVDTMQMLSTVAKGAGTEFETVLTMAEKMWHMWNMNERTATSVFAVISRTANEMNIPFEKLSGTVMGINDSFKMWGESSMSTMGILKQMNGVLQEQGLGFEASLDIVQQLAGSVKQMGIEKKAFLALGAGLGSTPVSGGLQIERMIQEGEWGKVMPMLQDAIAGIGGTGRTVTLEEAAETPGMEAAFIAQRQALGMFGITDTGAANRVLDVMSRIEMSGQMTFEQDKALEDVFKQGATIQDRQYNAMVKVANDIEVIKDILPSIEANTKVRQGWFGAEGVAGKALGAENREERARGQRDRFVQPAPSSSGLAVDILSKGLSHIGELLTGDKGDKTSGEEGFFSKLFSKKGINISPTGGVKTDYKTLAKEQYEPPPPAERAVGGGAPPLNRMPPPPRREHVIVPPSPDENGLTGSRFSNGKDTPETNHNINVNLISEGGEKLTQIGLKIAGWISKLVVPGSDNDASGRL